MARERPIKALSDLMDGSVEGVEHESEKLFSVQYQPHDERQTFAKFIAMMEEEKKNA